MTDRQNNRGANGFWHIHPQADHLSDLLQVIKYDVHMTSGDDGADYLESELAYDRPPLYGPRVVQPLEVTEQDGRLSFETLRLEPDVYKAFRSSRERRRELDRTTLNDFIKLGSAPVSKVLKFARAWGPLGVCDHNQPARHDSECWWIFRRRHSSNYSEPVEGWRTVAELASAIANIASHLQQDEVKKPGRVEDWQVLSSAPWLHPISFDLTAKPGTRKSERLVRRRIDEGKFVEADAETPDAEKRAYLEYLREALGTATNRWLQSTGVVPCVERVEEVWTVRMVSSSLVGALGTQLMMLVSESKGIATCFECGEYFTPKRKRSAGRRDFCPNCQDDGVPVKHASRDYRARKKSQKAP